MASQPLASAVARDISRPEARPRFWLPVATLWWRELVRFYRQRSRVVGTVGTPLLFWLLIGLGFGDSFRGPAPMNYFEYFFPGTILLVVLFTSIFSNMSLIEDRREGFLLSVLVAPVSRAAIVMSKVLGGATLALLQGLIFLALAPVAGLRIGMGQAVQAAGALFVIALALTALGFCFAWRLDSSQGFHGVMNLLLMPMWMLSGALFPVSGAHSWVGWVMRLNPLTYGLGALRRILYHPAPPDSPSLALSLGVMAGFGLLAVAVGLRQVGEPGT
jgi:ABC-2 type transport system permease protein